MDKAIKKSGKLFSFKRLTSAKKVCYNAKGNDEKVANAKGCVRVNGVADRKSVRLAKNCETHCRQCRTMKFFLKRISRSTVKKRRTLF